MARKSHSIQDSWKSYSKVETVYLEILLWELFQGNAIIKVTGSHSKASTSQAIKKFGLPADDPELGPEGQLLDLFISLYCTQASLG